MIKIRDPYRPERHYMRGPGPKWHEKHEAALVSAAGAQRELGAGPSKAQGQMAFALWVIPVTAAALLGFMAVVALT
ncbi:MAG: hypothetical protein ACOYB4_09040 [Methyloceanibacter sp.]